MKICSIFTHKFTAADDAIAYYGYSKTYRKLPALIIRHFQTGTIPYFQMYVRIHSSIFKPICLQACVLDS
jgi:hypothetical protein